MDDQSPASQATAVLAWAPGAGENPTAPAGEPTDLVGLLAVVCAGLLPVVFFDQLYWGTFAPKAALCLVLAFPGLVILARLIVARSRPAVLAAGFLAVAGLSTALSDKPAMSLVGLANWGTGLLFVAALAGAWALGAFASDRRRRQLVLAIIAGSLVNALVAWGQAQAGVGGRSRGLMGNPVYMGALVAGGLWLVARRFGAERRSWYWLPGVVLLAGAVQLSGGRAAAALAAAAVLAALRGAGVARAAALVAALVAGVVLAPLVSPAGTVVGSDRAALATTAGSNVRQAVWRITPGAVAERPLVGWGPGRFGAATLPRYDRAAAESGETLTDAHNWVIEYAVTTGVVGLALLLAWLGTAAWGARGPLAGFALIVGASSLVQPLSVALTPIAMLALGAAGTGRGHRWGEGRVGDGGRLGRSWGAVVVVALGVGLSTAAVLVAGQLYLQRGVEEKSPHLLERARLLSPPWPELFLAAASVEADGGLSRGLSDGEPYRRRTLQLSRRAARRDPAVPGLWTELGRVELAWGSNGGAAAAFRHALQRNPWDRGALVGRVRLAGRVGDGRMLAESCRRLRILGAVPTGCPAASR